MLKPLLTFLIQGILFLNFAINLNGQIWNTQIADSMGIAKGSYISLALDKSDHAHILYQDLDFMDLKYVTNKSGNWEITNLDTFGISGTESSMTIDKNDNLHICYHRDPGIFNVNSIIYGKYENNTWIFEEIDTTRNGMSIQTDINTYNGTEIGLIYFLAERNELIYAKNAGTEWSKETVDDNFSGFLSKLLYKKDGSPVICSIKEDSILVYEYNASTWQLHKIKKEHGPSFAPFRTFDAAIDSEDNLHFVCNVPDPNYITYYKTSYLYYNWDTLMIQDLGMTAPATPSSIIITSDDSPYIFTSLAESFLYKKTDAQWEKIIISDKVSHAGNASLKLDSHGNPYIAFYGLPDDAPFNKEAYVMCFRYFSSSPVIKTSPKLLNFGDVWIDSYSDELISVKNNSDIPLTIHSIEPENTANFTCITNSLPELVLPWDSTFLEIRFDPDVVAGFNDAMLVYSDDVYNPVDTVKVIGNGVDNNASGSLKVIVNDVYFSEEYLALINTNPAEGVSINLYKNNVKVAGPVQTDVYGFCQLSDLEQGSYLLKASKGVSEPNGTIHEVTVNKNLEIGPSVNSFSLSFPDSLLRFKFKLMHDLKHISPESYGHLSNYNYVGDFSYGNSLMSIYELLDSWMPYMTDQKAQSLARLILVEQFTYDLFEDGTLVGSDMMNCLGDLIAYIYYSDEWGQDLLKLLKAIATLPAGGAQELYDLLLQILIRELIKITVIENINMTVKFAAAKVGNPAGRAILDGWKIVKNNYCGFHLHGFSEVKWDKIAGLVFKALKDPFIQQAYINAQTGKSIERAGNLSLKLDHNGTLEEAIIEKMDFIYEEKSTLETVHSYSDGLRTAASLMMQTQAILTWIATLDPSGIGRYLDQAAFYMRAGAYIDVGTALTMSTVGYFLVPLEMKDAVDKMYYPKGTKSIDLSSKSLISANDFWVKEPSVNPLSVKLTENSATYINELESIRTKITNNQEWDAVRSLFDLRDVEIDYERNLKNAIYPVLSGAHEAHQTITGFETEYDTLLANYSNAASDRLNTYLTVVTLASDSSDVIKDKVLAYIDTCMNSVQKLADQTTLVLNLISQHIQLEASIAASDLTQSTYTISDDEESTIALKVKNYGDIATSDVSAKIELGPGLSLLGSDSVFIGELQPGEESDEITYTISFNTDTLEQSVWEIDFSSSSETSFPASGVILNGNKSTTHTQKLRKNLMVRCYPNPAQDDLIFYFNMDQAQKIKIEIYNQVGQLVSGSLNKMMDIGEHTLRFNISHLVNGTYLVRIKIGNSLVQTKNIVVIH